jgi:hypothetical protein
MAISTSVVLTLVFVRWVMAASSAIHRDRAGALSGSNDERGLGGLEPILDGGGLQRSIGAGSTEGKEKEKARTHCDAPRCND